MKSKKVSISFIILLISALISGNLCYSQGKVINQSSVLEIFNEIYMLDDFGCNIAVSTGHDGVLIIDSGSESSATGLDSLISVLSNSSVRYILNTHFHFDHVGGNKILADNGTIIIAQANTRNRMMTKWNVPVMLGIEYPTIPPYNESFLPKVCFKDSINIHFNNHTIQAIHFPNAHSDCDVIYFFKEANVIHTGDLFLSNGFPIIDIYHGGSINGYINAVSEILELCNDETIIIPGHGSITDRQGLLDYLNLLTDSRDRIVKLISENKSLEDVIKADPIDDLLKGKKSWLPSKLFVYVVYQELKQD
jgi:glyoxylase-like metal-dependent hydrolase (beta-lactamase superfamily II)